MGERKSFAQVRAEEKAKREARRTEIKANRQACNAEIKAQAEARKPEHQARIAESKARYEQRKTEIQARSDEHKAETQARAEAKKRSPIGGLFVASVLALGVVIDRADATVRAGRQTLPLTGTTVEFRLGNAHRRVTATRMALTGPLAFALKKDAGHNFLVFTAADGRQGVISVEPKHTSSAMHFVAEFNSLSVLLAAADEE